MKKDWRRSLDESQQKDYPLKDIVYLDGNYRTFKYFLTGQFDAQET